MVVPFEEPITIRRDVAEQMNQELTNFCLAVRDISEARARYRHKRPTQKQALDLYGRELDQQVALLKLAKLVLENVIAPNFD